MLPSKDDVKYDAILVFAVISAVASDKASRLEIVTRIVNYLNPGGVLFLGETLGSTFYRRGASGGRAFFNYKTDRDEVISTLVGLGMKILHESILGMPGDGYYNDCTDRIFVVAKK